MKSLRRIVLFGLFISPLVHSTARAGDDPVDILKKADAATKAVKAVAYETEFEGLGDAAAQMPKVKAGIKSGGGDGDRPKYFLLDLWVTAIGSDKGKHLTMGTDGEEYYVIDHDAKKAYVDIDPAVTGGAGRYAQMASVGEFGHPTPFSDEINGKKQELLGKCEVSGEEGFKIHVVYANDIQQATWCFSKKTFLPRERIDTFKTRDGEERSQKRTVTKLEVLDSVNADDFKLKLPAGFERIDDFYPG